MAELPVIFVILFSLSRLAIHLLFDFFETLSSFKWRLRNTNDGRWWHSAVCHFWVLCIVYALRGGEFHEHPGRIQDGCHCLKIVFWRPGLSLGFSKCLKRTRRHCFRQLLAIGTDGRFLRIEHSIVCVWDTRYSMTGKVWGHSSSFMVIQESIPTSGRLVHACMHVKNALIYP